MIETNLKEVNKIISKYGKDISKVNLYNKDFRNVDFSNIKLPDDNMLFQKATYKNLEKCIFDNIDLSFYNMNGISIKGSCIKPKCILPNNKDFFIELKDSSLQGVRFVDSNISEYSFDGVNITNTYFSDKVVLPNDKALFKKIKNSSLLGTTLPNGDYSEFDFRGVSLKGVVFRENSVFGGNKDLFQTIKDKSLAFAKLPSGDYSFYDFKGVSLLYTVFQGDVTLPQEYNFVKKVATIQGSELGDNYNKNAHLYDFTNMPYNIELESLSYEQEVIIYKKYEKELRNGKIKVR